MNFAMATRMGKQLAFLLLPLTGITLWFMHDGGMDFGWNLIWYWLWIIGFLLVHQATLLIKLVSTHKRGGFSRESRVVLLIGFVLLMSSVVFFVRQLN